MRAVDPRPGRATSSVTVSASAMRSSETGIPTILLLPTWTIIHSRFWKMQVPYLARHYRVITYDGPGNGRSDRATDPDRYAADSYAADAAAVLDACGVDAGCGRRAVPGRPVRAPPRRPAPGAGARPGPDRRRLPLGPAGAGERQDRRAVLGAVSREPPGMGQVQHRLLARPLPGLPRVLLRPGLLRAPLHQAHEDAVGWALEAGPEILEADARRPLPRSHSWERRSPPSTARCWSSTARDDRIQPHHIGVEAAQLGNGTLVSLEGAGHLPNARDPVRVNLLLRDFVEGLSDEGGHPAAAKDPSIGTGWRSTTRCTGRGHHPVPGPPGADHPLPDLEGADPSPGPSLPGGHPRRQGKRQVGPAGQARRTTPPRQTWATSSPCSTPPSSRPAVVVAHCHANWWARRPGRGASRPGRRAGRHRARSALSWAGRSRTGWKPAPLGRDPR